VAEEKDLNKAVDKLQEITSKDTVISIGGYSFTPAKLMIAAGIVSSTLGGLYGAFEVYKGYQDMKEKIAKYVAPDLSEFDKRLTVVEDSSAKSNDYTRDIKNDIKTDVRRLEKVVEDVERSAKQSQRETEKDVRELRKEMDRKIKEAVDNPLANK
jgi:hypothetical protein